VQANFRSWRDSGITWLAMSGLGVDKIMRRAGHDMVQTTMGYVKLAEDLTGDLGVPFGPLPAALVGGGSSAPSFALEALDRPLFESFFEALFRPRDRRFAVGDEVAQCGATIRVADVRDGRPTRLEVRLDRASPQTVVLLDWRDGHLARLPLPEVGAVADIPWQPGPVERREHARLARR
jgi:hypothetical protein